MVRRVMSLLSVILFIFLAADIVQGFYPSSSQPQMMLAFVDVSAESDLRHFEASGLPAYAFLTGEQGDYILAGVTAESISELESAGLKHRVLDDNTGDASYYLAQQVPDRPIPEWEDFGQMLLDDGRRVLLRMGAAKAEELSASGVQLEVLFLEPIVLQPREGISRSPRVIDPVPEIQAMMDQVLSTTVYTYDGGLSGEWPVVIDAQPYTIVTRNSYSGVPIQKATDHVGEHMEDLGLAVEYHTWNGTIPPNVIGEIPGESNPDDIFLITAHLDDMPSGPIAPGADDNASGSTAVMIAADILSQYQWDCTLRFAFFTGEEQGLLGSYAYAQRSFVNGENILGVLNLDMIAWNTPGSLRRIDLHAKSSVPGSVAIAQTFADVISAYNIDLIPEIDPGGSGGSDHVPFWNYGYAAILGIEDFGDFNPYYHSVNDLLGNMDLDYFTEFVRASIGTYAHMANCLIPTDTGALDGHVREEGTNTPIEGAEITLMDINGSETATQSDSSGYYTTTVGVGTYTVTVTAAGFFPVSVGSVEIFTDTVTTLDFYLESQSTYYYWPLLYRP